MPEGDRVKLRAWARACGRLVGWRAEALAYDPAGHESPAAGGQPAESPGPVDVIVPVHGAADAVERCFRSLCQHTDLGYHRLVVVVDGGPEISRRQLLAPCNTMPRAADVLWLENPSCIGFAASVNRGMRQSDRDVVLLNSDTVVTDGWLPKLQAAAKSDARIATVTPFSNHATICSLPHPQELNELPTGFDVETFARLVEKVSSRRYPRLPTGVGMCLYIKREALDRLGLFDVERFGPGYGEETDFCFRALKAGFLHVLDDATFIFHEGERSFGGRRAKRIRVAERTLRRLHPEYIPTLARFLAEDPLRRERQRVTTALTPAALTPSKSSARPSAPARVVHLVHGWPPRGVGGTELYAYWLAKQHASHRQVAVYARIADPDRPLGAVTEVFDEGLRVRLSVNNFTDRHPVVRNALRNPVLEADFEHFLDDVQPDLVHVHHLSGHGLSLLSRVAMREIPIVYQIQDWWALCARANLARPDRSLCPGPTLRRCSACLPLTGIPPAPVWNRGLYAYRSRLARRGLKLPAAFVMGSRAIERDYREMGLLSAPAECVYVLPYGVSLPDPVVGEIRQEARQPLRCGYIGALMPHKGVHVAVEAFAGIADPRDAVLDIWGDPEAAPDYTRELRRMAESAAIRFRGRFDEDVKSDIFAHLDLLLVPSLGLESFGLVAREAMAHGVPVIASRRGALQELFDGDRAGEGGTFCEPGDVRGLRHLIEQAIDRPEILTRWASRIPRIVGLKEHALEIERVYAETLARGGRMA